MTSPKSQGSFNTLLSLNDQADKNNNIEILNKINRTDLVAQLVKNPSAGAGDIRDVGSIPASGRSPGGGHGNLLQYSCLENPMDSGAWRATVHRVAKSWTEVM